MRLLRRVGIPLLAILILLALLLAAVVLIYEQKGVRLPFSRYSDDMTAEACAPMQEHTSSVFENKSTPNWRIIK